PPAVPTAPPRPSRPTTRSPASRSRERGGGVAVKLLHTADWHVGKAVRGRSRAAEHQAVLAEIAAVAERESVDLVVVAGDLFDTASPSPEAERIVYRALLDLAAGGRPVVVVAGNHDSAQRLAAVAPLSEASGIHVAAAIRPPGEGGVLELDVDGEPAQVALLPFPSQRYVVRADLLLAGDAADAHAAYADRVARIVRALTAGFRADTVNLVVGHLMVMGGTLGGGERGAHTVFDYWVPATAFPAAAQYVALGHLHRAQQLPGPAPLHYPGSPLQLDFGETANEPQVNVVALRRGRPSDGAGGGGRWRSGWPRRGRTGGRCPGGRAAPPPRATTAGWCWTSGPRRRRRTRCGPACRAPSRSCSRPARPRCTARGAP